MACPRESWANLLQGKVRPKTEFKSHQTLTDLSNKTQGGCAYSTRQRDPAQGGAEGLSPTHRCTVRSAQGGQEKWFRVKKRLHALQPPPVLGSAGKLA